MLTQAVSPTASDLLSLAKQEIGCRPLVAVDLVLTACDRLKHGDTTAKFQDLFAEFARAILTSEEVTLDIWNNNPSRGLFDRDIHARAKRLAAVSLLRLLAINDSLFIGELRFITFRLCDETLSKDVYPALKIDGKDMSHEKEAHLAQALNEVRGELAAQLRGFGSLLMLPAFKQQFLRTINGTISKAFIWPFMHRDHISRLTELFKLVEDYLEQVESRKFDCYRRAKDALQSFVEAASDFGTEYNVEVLGMCAQVLLRLMEDHFEESPISKPAELHVEGVQKKYPFHSTGNRVNLGLLLINDSQGPAFDVTIRIDEITDFAVDRTEVYVGSLPPGTFQAEISGLVSKPAEYVLATGEVTWKNFDQTVGRQDLYLGVQGQRADIDWEFLVSEDPYHLEPISTEDELVGRGEILNQLLAQALAKSMGSAYVYGQKRVGKTSVVKTLKTRIERQNLRNFMVVYLEGGDYVNPDPRATIDALGRRLCQEIRQSDVRFYNLDIPKFVGALAPLGDFLNAVIGIAPDFRVLFILDEFDELPMDLYKRGGPIADAFFLTIRSISGKPPFGFVLVGGEKMEYILSGQGTALNKFQPIRVDYFERETHWSDFRQLVCRPVGKWFEIAADALEAIYDQAAGNPYFTRLLCRSMYKLMVSRRDCHVTAAEVGEATRLALMNVGSNSFQHFWEDGLFYTGEHIEQISMQRRKVLVAVGECLRQNRTVTRDMVVDQAKVDGLSDSQVDHELKEFVRRQVLVSDRSLGCKVPFFEAWLKERGVKEIITTFPDIDYVKARKAAEEEAYVRSEEIVELVRSWGIYRGRSITEDTVRAWLTQFGSNDHQRLMFKILKNLRFYTSDRTRAKLREAHNTVRRGSTVEVKEGRQKVGKRSDILLSYIDGPGKSGAAYARLYADENGILKDNVIDSGKLIQALKAREGLHALVFLDDFVGTGDSASGNFKKLKDICGDVLVDANFKIFFISICGFQGAQSRVEAVIDQIGLPVKVHLCDPLSESGRVFSEDSAAFPDRVERDKARDVAFSVGARLEKDAPLGYGDCQAAVVFENSCPNNSLPILWSEAKDWMPLFKRL